MRRHDLDWLRVLVFALLILYHVGMFFVPWGWHIKNNTEYGWLRYPMLFLNQWRLPILFVISGMGTYYALSKRNAWQFAKERILRLYLPLAFGMLVIVPPQVYIERLAKQQFTGPYLEFWPLKAFMGIYPEGNISWHHLWFLPYLLLFSLLLIPAFVYLRKHPDNPFLKWINKQVSKPMNIYVFIIPIYFAESLLEPFFPVNHALIGDWFAFVFFLLLFFYGFLLISVQNSFWETVQKNRKKYLVSGILGFTVLLSIKVLLQDSIIVHFSEALVMVFNLWSWLLTLFGYAAQYLNKPSKLLAYCNEAVYPFYILHQTVTIVLAYYIMNKTWGLLPKATILILGTFIISWLIYEFLIRRWKWIRPLFGLKKPKA